MGQENCKNIPHESMESMGSTVFSSILLSIISKKHGKIAWERMGKHGIYANEFIPL